MHTHAHIHTIIISNKPVCKFTLMSFMDMAFFFQGGNSSWKIHARAQRTSQERRQKESEGKGTGKSAVRCPLLDITWTHELRAAEVACRRHAQDQARY